MRSIVSQAINERKTSKIQRNDLLQTLLEMQNKHGSDVYTEEVIAGHSLSFLVGQWVNYRYNDRMHIVIMEFLFILRPMASKRVPQQ